MNAELRIRARRVYDPPEPADGFRVLVDRLWPRGLAKQDAAIDHWAKPIAPSTELRKWYGHQPDRYTEFERRYEAELDEPDRAEELTRLRERARHETVTLLTASKDIEHSQLPTLIRCLEAG